MTDAINSFGTRAWCDAIRCGRLEQPVIGDGYSITVDHEHAKVRVDCWDDTAHKSFPMRSVWPVADPSRDAAIVNLGAQLPEPAARLAIAWQ